MLAKLGRKEVQKIVSDHDASRLGPTPFIRIVRYIEYEESSTSTDPKFMPFDTVFTAITSPLGSLR